MTSRLADLVNRSWKEEPRGRRQRGTTRSGASISGGRITIVTIASDGGGSWMMDAPRSATFDPVTRDQTSMLRVHAKLHAFFLRNGITDLHLRLGARAGPHNAKAETHFCETILALVPGVRLHQVSANALRSWLNARGEELSRQAAERSWELALAAAQYAAEQDSKDLKALVQVLSWDANG
jgi:hypothetical protein